MIGTDELTLVEELLNTLDERTFLRHGTAHAAEDRLTSAEALSTWFAEHDLPVEVRADDLQAVRSLRSGLRSALLAEHPVDDALSGFPLHLAATGAGLRLAADTGSAGLDRVVEVVAASVGDGRWKRLKLCASTDCRWAFVDTSRSGGGRWCSMEVCGNRHKTRAYRQRQAG